MSKLINLRNALLAFAACALLALPSVALADEPDSFGWAGGSGRLKGIECTDVQETDGGPYATIVFQSSNYDQVRVDGVVYDNETPGEGVGTFTIPLQPNEIQQFEGLTTAMSSPHWISYTVYCATEPLEADLDAQAVLDYYSAVNNLFDSMFLGEKTSGEGAVTSAYIPRTETSLEGIATIELPDAPIPAGLTYMTSLQTKAAKCFAVHYYEDGYKLLELDDGAGAKVRYLLVPEGKEAPAGLDAGIVVLKQPVHNIYLCATAAMALFDAIDGIGAVTLSGADTGSWEIDAPKAALQSGQMRFAGRYSAPDYEMLLTQSCDLALESTMILHTPEVQEKIEQLGIPVIIERSSYETTPLARVEWAKLYGALLNREAEAEAFVERQAAVIDELGKMDNTGKTVAFFAVKSDGTVTIRRPSDYVAQSIEIAGGVYAFHDLQVPGTSNTLNITMEEFYNVASQVDYLVYNGTIQAPLNSMADLYAFSDTFANYKAVQNGNVFTTTKDFYQATDKMAETIMDFNILVTEGDENALTFLRRVE